MILLPPWSRIALVHDDTYLFDPRVMEALENALPGASPEDIAQAVEDYLTANPPDANSTWGDIDGTLSAQTDLQNALDAKIAAVDAAKKYTTYVSVKDFGAVGDGTTDDTAAVNSAIAYANALNPGVVEAANVLGVTLFFPWGRYRIAGQLTAVTKSGIDFKGAGDSGTVVLLEYDGPTFRWGNGLTTLIVGGGISDMKIEYISTPSGSATVAKLELASRLHFGNLMLVNTATVLDLGVSAARYASSVTLSEVRGYVNNSGRPVVRAVHGAGLYVDAVRVFVGGVNAPAIDRVSTMTTLPGTEAIRLGEGSWDSVQVTGSFFERFDTGIHVSAESGSIVSNIFTANTYFDYHKSRAVLLEAQAGGGIYGVRLASNWYASWEEAGIQLSGAGAIRGVTISGGQIATAGTHGVSIGGSNTREVSVDHVAIQAVNRTDVNAQGILVLAGSHINIDSNTAGYDTSWSGFAWQAYAGVYVVAELDHWSITNNDLDGIGGGLVIEASAGGSADRIVYGNRGNVNAALYGNPVVDTTAVLSRSNHTGTQSADTLTDGTANKVFTAAEKTKLTGVATGATANSADATLLNRANHTGTQSADTIIDGTTNKAYTAAEKTKLAGVATGATANSSDATLLNRANHTGSQAQSTITNLTSDLALKANLASPTFTGTVSAPTPTGGDNSTKVATTAFIQSTLSGLAGTYAPLASPALTGNPTAPTPTVADSDTSIATTAFVNTNPRLPILMTQTAYNAITPVAGQVYIITGP